MEQHIGFCTTPDGVNLAYATIGEGPPLVKVANWLSHLEFDWQSPIWRHWMKALSSTHQLIRYDERGCGLSDWEVDDFTFDAWVQDLEAVVDAIGIDRFPLFGLSQGGPIAIAYAVRHPERVSQLIIYGSYVRGELHRGLSEQQREESRTLVDLVRLGWGKENPAFRQVFTTLFIPEGTPEQWSWFNELQRLSASAENAGKIVEGFGHVDVRELAPLVDTPTLVLHARGDARIPFEEGQLLASLIPNARFVPLNSKNHILLEEEPAWQHFLGEVQSFLGVPDESAQTLTGREHQTVAGRFRSATVLFADLVGFTSLSETASPEMVVAMLNDVFSHFDLMVEKYGLEKIRITGDEYMAAAGIPRQRSDHAVAMADAALEMLAYVNQLPERSGRQISFRFGMDVGPVTGVMIGRSKLQYDIWGDTVNVASRMESMGVPGKIQMTANAHALLKEQFVCEYRGNIQVKGKGKLETWFLVGRKQ